MSRSAILLGTLLLCGLTACSGAPEIPDQQKTRTYQSSEQDAQSPTADATDAQPAAQPNAGPTTPPADEKLIQATGPVAMVNGQPLAAAKFNERVNDLASSGQVPAGYINNLKQRLVEGMVDKMLLDQAVGKSGIAVTETDIDDKIKQSRADFEVMKKFGGDRVGTFEAMLQKMGIKPGTMRESMKQALVIEALLKQNGYSPMTDDELKTFYDDNLGKFRQPETVRARHILIKVPSESPTEADWTKAEAKIKAVRKDIVDNKKDFAEVAKVESQGPSNVKGGDLGFFAKQQMVPPFAEAAFAMKDGELSQPVKTRFGWHIIKRESFKPSTVVSFDEIKGLLRSQLSQQKFQEAVKAYLAQLRTSATIEYKLENIK